MVGRAALMPLVCAALLLMATDLSAQTPQRPSRTFPQFVGTWVLDEAASTGRIPDSPRFPRILTLAITPETITLTRRLRLSEAGGVADSPKPEVYRLDETRLTDDRTGAVLDVSYRFTLVADMLALTKKESRTGWDNGFTLVTDALAVEGDVLTLHRQLVSVAPEGTIYTMSEPTNNFRHTYIYRRVASARAAP